MNSDRIIDRHIMLSMGAGAVPIPLVDVAAVTAIQLNMLKELCANYGVDYSESFGKNLIRSIVGAGAAKVGASAVKAIPGVGSLLGGASMVVLSGTSTYALGQVFKSQLQVNTVLSKFDLNNAKKMYEEAFERGKSYVQDLRSKMASADQDSDSEKSQADDKDFTNNETASAQSTSGKVDDVLEKLKALADLKDNGILTEEEFQAAKQKLLAQL